MADRVVTDPAQLALERRIRELDEENSRLSRELQVLSYDIHEHQKAEAALAESVRQQREITRLLELDQARLGSSPSRFTSGGVDRGPERPADRKQRGG